ncbi:MAG TPA: hypothetical protein VLJ41_02500 [Segetibacter sp.]|nr:hypothetical protein [Segetibacter sp.]
MKYKANLRYILIVLTLLSGFSIIEKIRIINKRAPDKTDKKVSRESGSSNISNTDFIFFESLSKYLFISLEK